MLQIHDKVPGLKKKSLQNLECTMCERCVTTLRIACITN